jgi:tetratricopeptide (TPR) repeat protein
MMFKNARLWKGKIPMKLRLFKGTLLLASALIAGGLYLRMDRRQSSIGPLAVAHEVAGRQVIGGQREKEMLTLALEKNSRHAPVLLRLAEIESEDGHLQESAEHLRRILQAEPGNPEANLELGKVLFQLGDIRGAIEHTGAILHTHPAYADALYNMGAIYANIGNKRSAKEYWERLAALQVNSENAKKALLMLSRLETNSP